MFGGFGLGLVFCFVWGFFCYLGICLVVLPVHEDLFAWDCWRDMAAALS